MHIQKNQKFLFVPYIYNGNLYEYSKTSDGWQQTRVVKGVNQQKPYTIVEDDGERKADAGITAVDLAKKKEFIVHNLTRGLFKYKGHIFHFIFTDINNERVLDVEVYDKNLNAYWLFTD
ncbi:MAG: hypothetical protein U5J63_04205 [Fodinibius sp.]|nr:hypothetical protein [Fodinibius sp.]